MKKIISLGLLLTGVFVNCYAANIALVPQTGQTANLPLNSAPAGSDGALQKGAAWPTTRFVLDTTGNCIIDNLTGLMWVKDLDEVNAGNSMKWAKALTTAHDGTWCGYNDWRMPNLNELHSLVNYGYAIPAEWLMYGSGNSGSPTCSGACFNNIKSDNYWTSSSSALSASSIAFRVYMHNGVVGTNSKSSSSYLFPVRGGQ